MNSTVPVEGLAHLGSAWPWSELNQDRRGFQREFVRLLRQSPQLAGRVLDIGCGGGLPAALESIPGGYGSLDGVDPDASVHQHPLLDQRWQGTLESCAIPAGAYDLAYAYNVLEHIGNPAPFFRKIHDILKPGGVFWGLTPSSKHPFAWLSRSIERIGLKSYARAKIGRTESGAMAVNDYPAYYRCNSPGAVLRAIRGLGFRRASFYYCPCLQWDTYFPRWLRWAPHAYDYLVGTRMPGRMQILMVRIDK